MSLAVLGVLAIAAACGSQTTRRNEVPVPEPSAQAASTISTNQAAALPVSSASAVEFQPAAVSEGELELVTGTKLGYRIKIPRGSVHQDDEDTYSIHTYALPGGMHALSAKIVAYIHAGHDDHVPSLEEAEEFARGSFGLKDPPPWTKLLDKKALDGGGYALRFEAKSGVLYQVVRIAPGRERDIAASCSGPKDRAKDVDTMCESLVNTR